MPDQNCPDTVRHLEPVPAIGLVHTAADRRLSVEHWLLSALDATGRDRARMQWQKGGVTLLPLGTLFSAVRIPEPVVHTITRADEPQMAAEYLAAALDDGPVIHDPAGHRYYVLVPASMPTAWHKAADDWHQELGVDCLGRDTYLGVPPVDAITLDPVTNGSYWAVQMPSMGMLCEPMAVAQLIAAAARRLTSENGAC